MPSLIAQPKLRSSGKLQRERRRLFMQANDSISIGQLAERTGVSVSAVRFYEARGLVSASRNAGGQRRFLRSDVRRVAFVLIAQKLGFTIAEIGGQLASLPRPAGWLYRLRLPLIEGLRPLQSRRPHRRTRARPALSARRPPAQGLAPTRPEPPRHAAAVHSLPSPSTRPCHSRRRSAAGRGSGNGR